MVMAAIFRVSRERLLFSSAFAIALIKTLCRAFALLLV